jgi:hypothetical protein
MAVSSALVGFTSTSGVAATHATPVAPNRVGALDCNGLSPIQKSVRAMDCTDIRGFANEDNVNTWDNRFYDNGVYIGHDEPDATFLSNRPGSGNDVTWSETLGTDPHAAPGDRTPGKDVSHWFELSPAPWLSMAMCDPNSYPELPCTPESDANAPACAGSACSASSYPGGGSAFMEMQFYPPGNAPFVDNESCNNTDWCAALTIDSLECTEGFATCNPKCEEPVNFAFIQTNGVPTGPPAPQTATTATYTPNSNTLLMRPGDKVAVHLFDSRAPGGGDAFKVAIDDLTEHTSGTMQASAANGFMNTSMADCSGTPFNFQPEYSSASAGNVIPWAALQTDVSTEFETGHWEPCTSLSDEISNPFDPADVGGTYNECNGPYETAGGPEGAESGDALCYYAGDTHPGYDGPGTSTPPNEMTGCQDNVFQNGDLDFDGTPYWTEWPTSTRPGVYPGSFVDSPPTTGGRSYSDWFAQTDIALSESTCSQGGSGCTVPPSGPGGFYPYWSLTKSHGECAFEFGNVRFRANDFGGDAQYGTDQFARLGYDEFEGPIHRDDCMGRPGGGSRSVS